MRRTLTALAAAALALPCVAHAQARYDEPRFIEPEEKAGPKMTLGVMGEIGLDDYARDLNHDVDAGVGYGARVDLSPSRNFGLELGYHGAVNNMNDKLTSDGRLITNQFGGDLRINIVPPDRDLPGQLRPYVFGGAYYHRVDTDNFTPGVRDDINAFALPVGLGLDANIGKGFLIGGRFGYNFLFNEVDKFNGRNADYWTATLNLGTRLGR